MTTEVGARLFGVAAPRVNGERCGACGNCMANLKNEDLRLRYPGLQAVGQWACTGIEKFNARTEREKVLRP